MIRASIPQHLHPVPLDREERTAHAQRFRSRREMKNIEKQTRSRGSRETAGCSNRPTRTSPNYDISTTPSPCVRLDAGDAVDDAHWLFSSLISRPHRDYRSRRLRELARKHAIILEALKRVAFVRYLYAHLNSASALPWHVRIVLSSLVLQSNVSYPKGALKWPTKPKRRIIRSVCATHA